MTIFKLSVLLRFLRCRLSTVAGFAALCLIGVSTAFASTQVATNQARVPVTSQSAQARQEAQEKALRHVFIKTTGNQQVVDNQQVRQALRKPADFLIAYEYRTEDNQLYYVAEFSRQAINNVIRQASLTLWGARRPDTLMWVAVDDESERWILREEQNDELARTIVQYSEDRGIPVSLPLMDLTDNTSISVTDVWAQFAHVLRNASARYQPDLILSARIHPRQDEPAPDFLTTDEKLEQALSQSNLAFAYEDAETPAQQKNIPDNNGFDSDVSAPDNTFAPEPEPKVVAMQPNIGEGDIALDWLLLEGKSRQFGTYYGKTAEQAMANLLASYADYLGARFAIQFENNAGENPMLRISVANLDSLAKYARAQRFLSDLSVASSARLVSQDGPVAQFDIELAGSAQDFTNALSFESRLQRVKDAMGQPLDGYNFYWNE